MTCMIAQAWHQIIDLKTTMLWFGMDKTLSQVKTGLQQLVDNQHLRQSLLNGKRVAILTNPTGVTSDLKHILEHAKDWRKEGIEVVRLFAPEHGIFSEIQYMEKIEHITDPVLGCPVFSLYGDSTDTLRLQHTALSDIDVLIIDIHTYAYTAAFAYRACVASGTKCIVLDRPNPISGLNPAGHFVQDDYRSFVGEYAIPNRTGLTLGELMYAFADIDDLAHDHLEVIWMKGWHRSMYFEDTDLPWVMPSPNMQTIETTIVYPGGCLLEGTNLSEGRGTTKPFELVGAPYIENPFQFKELAEECISDGCVLRAVYFQPTWDKHQGKKCGGVEVHVTARGLFDSIKTYMGLIYAASKYTGFDWRREPYEFVSDRLAIDLLFGDNRPRAMYENQESFEKIYEYTTRGQSEINLFWQKYQHKGYGV